MVGYDSFSGRVGAHFSYALDLPVEQAVEIFTRRLNDGTWLAEPGEWANRFAVLLWRSGDTDRVRQLLDDVAVALMNRPLDRVTHAALLPLARSTKHGWNQEQVARLARWLADRAQPGDASLVADFVEATLSDERREDAVVPAAAWLVRSGDNELRQRLRFRLALGVVGLVREIDDLVLPALRYLFENEASAASYRSYVVPKQPTLLSAVEAVLEARRSDAAIVSDLARWLGEGDAATLLSDALADSSYPHLNVAVRTALGGGLLEPRTAVRTWELTLGRVPAADVSFTRTGLDAVLVAFDRQWHNHAASEESEYGWASRVTRAVLATDFRDTDITGLQRVLGIAAHPGMEHGVRDALRQHAAGRSELGVVSALLAEPTSGSGALRAALEFLRPRRPNAHTASSKALEARVARHVETIMQTEVARDPLLGDLHACSRVCFEDSLGREDKVFFDGDTLRVERAAMSALLATGLQEDDVVAAGVHYVIHEIVHLWQRIGDKSRVARLRATGAETTLMHIDLGADHVAAVVIARALPNWTLVHLKDIGGRALAAFPTEAHHTTAARSRKARRLVGARLDYLARETRAMPCDADEYAFAEYNPAGGSLVLMRSGPPWGVLGDAPLAPEDAETLHTAAARGSGGLAAIDQILKSALTAVWT